MPAFDLAAAAVAAAFFAILAAIALSDLIRLRIPNALTLGLLALYPLHVILAREAVAVLPALGLAALVFALGAAIFATGRIGGGDVKLLSVVALWAGPDLIFSTLVLTALIGGAMAIVMLSPLRFVLAFASESLSLPALREVVLGRHLPYGVAIAAAAAISIGPRLAASG
jgi:prepilin peptidase CpaA